MSKHNAVPFPHPQAVSADPLTEVLRQGGQAVVGPSYRSRSGDAVGLLCR